MPRVADVLLAYYTTIGSLGSFCIAEVRFVMLGFIVVI
jgi:hypothetical protein